MKSRILVFIFLILYHSPVLPQGLNFLSPAEVCLSEQIKLQNDSGEGFNKFEWDFCEGDILEPISSINSYSFSEIDQASGIRVVEDNDLYYGFVLDRAANSLFRLSFGANLSNAPSAQQVILPSDLSISAPQGLNIIQASGEWYCFITSSGNNKVFRLDFGTDITSTPSVTEINFQDLSTPTEIEIAYENDNYFLLVLNFGGNSIVAADLGSTITNHLPHSFQATSLSGSSNPYGFDIVKSDDGIWRGVAGSFSNNSFQSFEFISGLGSTADVTNITSALPIVINPVKLELANWGDENVMLVMTNAGVIHRVHFTKGDHFNSVSNSDILIDGFGSTLPLSLFYDKGNWIGFTFPFSRALFVFNFNKPCNDVNTPYYLGETPPLISYNSPSSEIITLRAVNSMGFTETFGNTIQVQDKVSPLIQFNSLGVCLDEAVNFFIENSDQIEQFSWSFGDSQTSTVPNPTHHYTAVGDYNVSLQVTAENGCNNYAEKTINIYNSPEAEFALPDVNVVCTNQVYLFENQSVFDEGSDPSWTWYVDDNIVSDIQDLQYLFEDGGTLQLKLVASIPGCSSEAEKQINNVVVGPAPEFAITGQCEEDVLSFTNFTTGEVSSYSWDFDDSQTSDEFEPEHVYQSVGEYNIRLTATNAEGCSNFTTKEKVIYAKPTPDFSLALPPFSCAGTESMFYDETPNPDDSNLSTWLWNFGTGFSELQYPVHVFDEPGDYEVSLTVTTDKACSATLSQVVSILPAPIADFEHSAACVINGVDFTNLSLINGAGEIAQYNWQIDDTQFSQENINFNFETAGSYNVSLTITASNGCSDAAVRNISVQGAPLLDFNFSKNCAGHEALFQESVQAFETDPIEAYTWVIAGQEFAGESLDYVFTVPGNAQVMLKVLTAEGCEFDTEKEVNVVPAPQASFTASATLGAVPLEVIFNNTSQNAAAYTWTIFESPEIISNSTHLDHTFSTTGDFIVDLVAGNDQGCEDVASTIINVVDPIIDLEVKNILLQSSAGITNVVVVLQNNSNAFVSNFTLNVDIGGPVVLQKVFTDVLAPGELFNALFDVGFSSTNTNLKFLCAEVIIDSDINVDNNIYCLNLEERLIVFHPYPNPVRQRLFVDVISEQDTNFKVLLINQNGAILLEESLGLNEGLNQLALDLDTMPPGIYLLNCIDERTGQFKVFRISVIP